MLVFTRKLGEGIVIGRDIELTVLKKKGQQVRLAITAPPNVAIRRGELLEGSNSPSVLRPVSHSGKTSASKQEPQT